MRWRTPVALLGLATSAMAFSEGWNFTWPSSTQQCQNVTISITGGSPPWVVGLVPIGGVPIVWTVSADPEGPPNITNPITARIPIQFPAGTWYTVVLADQIGYAGGARDVLNPYGIQVVRQSTNAACLANPKFITQEFTFGASGTARTCSPDFTLSWNDYVGRSPYSFTVIPLDTAYHPWDVALRGGAIQPGEVWRVNMTEGSRFTIVMSNDNGWGRGGVGQVYEVGPGSANTTCISQNYQGRVAWPAGITPSALPATASFTTTILAASSAPASNVITSASRGSSVSSEPVPSRSPSAAPADQTPQASATPIAAIAGGVAGGLVGLALAGLLAWFLIRRRSRRGEPSTPYAGRMDLSGDGDHHPGAMEPKLEPYQPVPLGPNSPDQPYASHQIVQHGNTITSMHSATSPYAPYSDHTGPSIYSSPAGTTGHDNARQQSGIYSGGSEGGFLPLPVPLGQMQRDPSRSSISSLHDAYNQHGPPHSASHRDSFGSYNNPAPAVPTKSTRPPTFMSLRTDIPAGAVVPQSSPPLGTTSASGASDLGPTALTAARAEGGSAPGSPQPQLPPGASPSSPLSPQHDQSFEFVRHTDGGEVPQQQPHGQPERQRVDLPPMYEDVPRRNPA